MIVETLLAVALGASVSPATASSAIPIYTHELALSREPRAFPFTAFYSKGGRKLAFVAARHENGDVNSTAAAIRSAFAALRPDVVVLEGFPTKMGESPSAMATIAASRGKSGESPFANGETMLAANIAIASHIPFVGGEPSDRQQVQALTQAGFAAADVLFVDILKAFPQFIRSGQIAGPADPKFAGIYERISDTLAHNRGSMPMPLSDFETRYRSIFGIDAAADPNFVSHADPSEATLVGKILAAEGQVRDVAIFELIKRTLQEHKRVLVVYGGSHWTTLSGSLDRELGRPRID